MLSFGFRIFCWYRGFCHRTGSDLLLFLFISYYRHPTSRNEVNVSLAASHTRKQHVNTCVRIATMLIHSEMKTHSLCDDNEDILNIRWT